MLKIYLFVGGGMGREGGGEIHLLCPQLNSPMARALFSTRKILLYTWDGSENLFNELFKNSN